MRTLLNIIDRPTLCSNTTTSGLIAFAPASGGGGLLSIGDLNSARFRELDRQSVTNQVIKIILDDYNKTTLLLTSSGLTVIDTPGLVSSTATTRAMFPQGIDVAQRLIRMSNLPRCAWEVEEDVSVASGEQTEDTRYTDSSYVDLSLITSGTEKFDYRKLQS